MEQVVILTIGVPRKALQRDRLVGLLLLLLLSGIPAGNNLSPVLDTLHTLLPHHHHRYHSHHDQYT